VGLELGLVRLVSPALAETVYKVGWGTSYGKGVVFFVSALRVV